MRGFNGRTDFLNRRACLLALLLLCAGAQAAAGRQAAPRLEWRPFTSEAGGFTVKFPGTPRITRPQMVKGPLNIQRNLHEVSVGDVYRFELDYMDMPAGYSDPDLALEGGISGLTNPLVAQGGRVLSNVRVERGTCLGREATVLVTSPSGKTNFIHGRVFASGQRYYMVIFSAAEDGPAARAVGRTYVDSLVINDGCRAPLAPTAAPTAAPVRRTVAGAPDAATGWRRIASDEHGFSVLMPGPAEFESKQAQVQPFPIYHHEYGQESDEAIYTAEVLGDYPEGFYGSAVSFENQMDVIVYAVRKNMEALGVVFGEPRKLSVGRYPGREYLMANEQAGIRGRVRLYATPRRAYVFLALNRSKSPAAAAASLERFFSSIRISPK